jgi:hypothetical protein
MIEASPFDLTGENRLKIKPLKTFCRRASIANPSISLACRAIYEQLMA